MQMKHVVSLYDFTGEALRPWALGGYKCHAFDIQHKTNKVEVYPSGGSITYHYMDLHDPMMAFNLHDMFEGDDIVFGMAFPVCTDMAVSGAAHFAKKRKENPWFQVEAVGHAKECSVFFGLRKIPFFIENPVSVLSTQWRKPDHIFHPYEYGGYIPESESTHPLWPEYIAPFDAYPKKTCLWTGGGFIMPETKPVPVPEGYSDQHKKLGGKSQKTKDIRSATPRGFAKAVFEANKVEGY